MRLTDPNYLLTQQYRDSGNLGTRSSLHERFSTNPTPWHRWVFDRLPLTSEAQVLEIGCGSGMLWSANLERLPAGCRFTLSDFSFGMVTTASNHLDVKKNLFRFARLDAQSIPFASATFDVVIANHMLYHVPDRQRALAEISRVLRPGGQFFAATNGAAHMHELHAWVHEAAGLPMQGFPLRRSDEMGSNFTLENGAEQLLPFFSQVDLLRRPDNLRVTEVQPVIDYVRTIWTEDSRLLDETGYQRLETLLVSELERSGAIHISKSGGLFRAIK
jgi:SAM-dependent methyltransferase